MVSIEVPETLVLNDMDEVSAAEGDRLSLVDEVRDSPAVGEKDWLLRSVGERLSLNDSDTLSLNDSDKLSSSV